jgi:hypothetical protein
MRKLVRRALEELTLPAETVQGLASFRRHAERLRDREAKPLDIEIAGRLALTEDLDLLAALVCFYIYEHHLRPRIPGIADWPMSVAGRSQRFEIKQAAIWLRDAMPTRGLPSAAGSYRAMARVVGALWKASGTLQREAARLARELRPEIHAEIIRLRELQHERDRQRTLQKIRELRPYGTNPDGSFDIYRAEGF